MDLLYQRYASPFSLIDGMIQTKRFSEFVENLVITTNKEKDEKMNWEFWLHKVFSGTFEEFLNEIEINRKNQTMSKKTIEATVNDSLSILKNFSPQNERGE